MRRTILVLIVMVTTLVAASGVALAVVRSGGPGNDYLTGTNAEDIMEGKGGSDTVLGFAESDVLYGGDGRDYVVGMRGDDVLYGGDGRDYVDGYGGEDFLYGGDGNDLVVASFDGSWDRLDCGKGKDHYAADKIDYVSSSCEVKVFLVRAD